MEVHLGAADPCYANCNASWPLAEPVYLIDVRQSWEHETVALPDGLLIPLGKLQARSGVIKRSSWSARGCLLLSPYPQLVRSRFA